MVAARRDSDLAGERGLTDLSVALRECVSAKRRPPAQALAEHGLRSSRLALAGTNEAEATRYVGPVGPSNALRLQSRGELRCELQLLSFCGRSLIVGLAGHSIAHDSGVAAPVHFTATMAAQ
eukprot:scaffold10253_cov124-Isochrysis_galbana.AAC.16